MSLLIKGAQAWDIRGRFFFKTQIRPVRVDDLGTGEKNDISQVGAFMYFKVFATNIFLAYAQHAINDQKNFKLVPPNKLCEMPWGPSLKGQERFLKNFVF
jgi:hypothetical protein